MATPAATIARARSREVFVPLVHLPGYAQVDFGECVGVIGGVRMKLHVFCFDLPQSDACFSGSCHFLRGAGRGSILVRIQVPTPLISFWFLKLQTETI